MTNHPNRNWRAAMRASAEAWLTTPQGRALVESPGRLEDALRQAYQAGYEDGRKR